MTVVSEYRSFWTRGNILGTLRTYKILAVLWVSYSGLCKDYFDIYMVLGMKDVM